MRIGIYGNHLALALIACAEVADAANHKPVWRNDVMFKSDQTEHFDTVVALETSFAAKGIAEAYAERADAPPVFLVPQVETKAELLASDAFRAYAAHLGIALPTPEDLVAEIEAEAKARESATVATPPGAPADDDSSEPLLPKIADLAAHVATITDADALLDLMQRDTRKTAAPIYDARFAELTGSDE